MNNAACPRFGAGGAFLKKQPHAKYLGVVLSADGTATEEIKQRIGQTMATWKKMDKIWKLKTCRVKTRLKYWNAIVRTKLTYALHTIALTEPQKSKLRAFQLKGLRKVLGVKTTYINRRNTNNRVYQLAESVLNDEHREEHQEKIRKGKKKPKLKKAPRLRDINHDITDLAMGLLGHIVREHYTCPTREVTFRTGIRPNIPQKGHNRKGRPKKSWILTTLERSWKKVKPRLFKAGHREGWGKQLINPKTWRFNDPVFEEQLLDAGYKKWF